MEWQNKLGLLLVLMALTEDTKETNKTALIFFIIGTILFFI